MNIAVNTYIFKIVPEFSMRFMIWLLGHSIETARLAVAQDSLVDLFFLGGWKGRGVVRFHYRIDLTAFDRRFYEGYRRVNAKFARVLYPLLRADDRTSAPRT